MQNGPLWSVGKPEPWKKSICGNEVPIEPVSAMEKPGTLWLSEILSKGQKKTQYYNSSLQTATKEYIAQIQPGKLALQTRGFNRMLDHCDKLCLY